MELENAAQEFLMGLVARHGAMAGTIHRQRGNDLYLVAAHNIPPPVVEKVRHVPHGKGMAGLAQVKRQPVQVCNLQTDDSGKAKPMARMVGGQAAVALPVLASSGEVLAVVGLAFAQEGDIPAEQEQLLMRDAAALPAGPHGP